MATALGLPYAIISSAFSTNRLVSLRFAEIVVLTLYQMWKQMVDPIGLEPMTYALKGRHSTNWVMGPGLPVSRDWPAVADSLDHTPKECILHLFDNLSYLAQTYPFPVSPGFIPPPNLDQNSPCIKEFICRLSFDQPVFGQPTGMEFSMITL